VYIPGNPDWEKKMVTCHVFSKQESDRIDYHPFTYCQTSRLNYDLKTFDEISEILLIEDIYSKKWDFTAIEQKKVISWTQEGDKCNNWVTDTIPNMKFELEVKKSYALFVSIREGLNELDKGKNDIEDNFYTIFESDNDSIVLKDIISTSEDT